MAGREIGRWACWAFAASAALSSFGCQDGYPIPATLCDEWCDQTRRIDCIPYDPAACVASCEKQGLTRSACTDLTTKTIECLKERPELTIDCQSSSTVVDPCLADEEAALECGSNSLPGGPQGRP